MSQLIAQPITTRIFKRGENLADFVVESVPSGLVAENMVVAVTSKIVSLAENRLEPKAGQAKETVVRREADHFLGQIGHGLFLTVKHGLLIASAGIDESNSETGDYILYPLDPYASATRLCQNLRRRWELDRLGVLLTDSKTQPLRLGVTGASLAHAGFAGVRDLRGQEDLFGRTLKVTRINLPDSLAATAVLLMGEGSESRPLVVLSGAPVEFHDDPTHLTDVAIGLEEDLYFPILAPLLGPKQN